MIRLLKLEDFEKFKFWSQKFRASPDFNWTPQELVDSWKTCHIWGFFSEKGLRACIALQGDAGLFEVLWLATEPESLRQGIMEKLLNNAKGHSSELRLEVHEKNEKALKLYLKAGFKQVGVRKNYYRDGAHAILMTWESKA